MLVDSHCHLDFPDFAEELDAVVTRAGAAGVGMMLTIGTRLDQFDGVRTVAERFDHVVCSVGVHPHEAAGEGPASPEPLLRLARHPKVVGIGETGLDYYYEHSPKEVQRKSFRIHIAAARTSGLPLIVHSRDADEDMGHILAEEMAIGPFTGVMHCFSSGWQLAETAVELGLYVSLSGLQQGRGGEGDRALGTPGASTSRNRCALSGPSAQPRQAQRAGLRRSYGGARGQHQGHVRRGARGRDQRQFLPPVHQGRPAGVSPCG